MKFRRLIYLLPLLLLVAYLIPSGHSRDVPQNFKVLKVKKGQTLIKILKDHGWDQEGIGKVVRNPRLKKRPIFPGETFFLTKEGKKKTLIFFTKSKDTAFFLSTGPDGSEIKYDDINFTTKIGKANGTVVGSLQASILKKVDSLDIAQRFMNAYLLEYNLRKDIQKGAKFKLHYEKKYIGDRFVKYGEVTYALLDIRGNSIEKDFVSFKNGGAFIDKNAEDEDKQFYSPVDYLQITSLYQPRRRHPISRRIIPHMGIDFALPKGAPIYAAGSGKIVKFGRGRAPGKYVVIDHGKGYKSYYNHLSKIETLKKGQKVNVGDKIGEIGCTGYCTKPHLHFAVKKRGRFINPAKRIRTYPFHQTKIIQANRN